ncbi:MAG: hypothetical protein JNK32_14400 [Anaerolineales bacterium]|nr:hypothetical protein [Anaerolineales bacterium]
MLYAILMICTWLAVACQPATPLPPVTAQMGGEFTLAPGETATLEGVGLSLTFKNVTNDGRCPLEVECAESGPVTLTISVQRGSSEPAEFVLMAFTDTDGRVPEGPFEGMQDRVEVEAFVIQVKAIFPFPLNFEDEIEAGEYRAAFVVLEK